MTASSKLSSNIKLISLFEILLKILQIIIIKITLTNSLIERKTKYFSVKFY